MISPSSDPGKGRLQRHREELLAGLSIRLAIIELCVAAAALYWVPSGWARWCVLSFVPPTLLAPAIHRATGSMAGAVAAINAPIFLLASIVMFLTGGLDGLTPAVFITGPIVGVTLAGPGVGLSWVIGSVLMMCAVAGVDLAVFPLVNDLVEPETLLLVNWVVALAIMVAAFDLAREYDRMRKAADGELQQANMRLGKLLADMDQASAALRHDAEKLGGGGHEGGLLARMRGSAGEGRRRLNHSRQSVGDMIAQYRVILSTVETFEANAEAVTELLGSIRRISERIGLMALQIGLEAAHMGSDAAQFALLAEDMRDLAESVQGDRVRIAARMVEISKRSADVLAARSEAERVMAAGEQDVDSIDATFSEMYGLMAESAEAGQRVTESALAHLSMLRQATRAVLDSNVDGDAQP